MFTPAMILAERYSRKGLSHSLNSDGGGRLYVDCTCATCKNYFDPTGEKDAAERNVQLANADAAKDADLAQRKAGLEINRSVVNALMAANEMPLYRKDDILKMKCQRALISFVGAEQALKDVIERIAEGRALRERSHQQMNTAAKMFLATRFKL